MHLRIDYLKNYPEYLPRVAGWVYTAWWSIRYPYDEVEKLYRTLLNTDRLPIALIALVAGKPAGTAVLCADDPDIHLEVTPWLEGLYVAEEYRNRGIGRALIERVENIAAGMQFNFLYLSSHETPYYEKWEYQPHRRLDNGDILMRKQLPVNGMPIAGKTGGTP